MPPILWLYSGISYLQVPPKVCKKKNSDLENTLGLIWFKESMGFTVIPKFYVLLTQEKVAPVLVINSRSCIHLKIPCEMMASFKFDIRSRFSNFLGSLPILEPSSQSLEFRTNLPNLKKSYWFFFFPSMLFACPNWAIQKTLQKLLLVNFFHFLFYLLDIELNSEPIQIS